MSKILNFDDTAPAADAGYALIKWKRSSTPDGVDPSTGYSYYNLSGSFPKSGGVSAKTANYTATAADNGTLLSFNSATAVTLTLPATPPFANWRIAVQNIGVGTLTVNRNGLTIDGAAANLTLAQNNGCWVFSDGTNYFSERGSGSGGGVSAKTASYTAAAGDDGRLISFNSSSAVTLTLPATAPSSKWRIAVQNIGAGTLTISPGGLTIDGATASLTLAQNTGCWIFSDGTNYFSERGSSGAVTSLTTTGTSGAATLSGGVLNIPIYSGGGGGGGVPWLTVSDPTSASFSWFNQGGATETVGAASRYLLAPGLVGTNMRGRQISAGSAPFSIKAGICFSLMTGNSAGGIYVTDGTKVVTFFVDAANHIGVNHFTNVTTFSSQPYLSTIRAASDPLFMKILDNGTNLIFYWSIDGANWLQLFSEGRTSFLASVSSMGFFADSNNASGPAASNLVSWATGTS